MPFALAPASLALCGLDPARCVTSPGTRRLYGCWMRGGVPMRHRVSMKIRSGREPGRQPRAARRALAVFALLALWAPSWAVVASQEPESRPETPEGRAQE